MNVVSSVFVCKNVLPVSEYIPAVWTIKFKKDVEIDIPALWCEEIDEEICVTVPQKMQLEKHFEKYDFSQDICHGVKVKEVDKAKAQDVLETWYHDLIFFITYFEICQSDDFK